MNALRVLEIAQNQTAFCHRRQPGFIALRAFLRIQMNKGLPQLFRR